MPVRRARCLWLVLALAAAAAMLALQLQMVAYSGGAAAAAEGRGAGSRAPSPRAGGIDLVIHLEEKPRTTFLPFKQPLTTTSDGTPTLSSPLQAGPPPRILIVASPRTGSSFLGALLSASNGTRYLFEPFRETNMELTKSRKTLQNFITGLYKGDLAHVEQAMSVSSHVTLSKPPDPNNRSPMVIKTVRLRYQQLMPWIRDHKLGIKVIHLVRDPRASYNSMRKRPGMWGSRLRHVDRECSRMEANLKLQKALGRRYYRLVRFVNLPFGDYEAEVAFKLTHKELEEEAKEEEEVKKDSSSAPPKSKKNKGYFSVQRSSLFDPESWKKELWKSEVLYVESACEAFMTKANYQFRYLQKYK